MLADGKIILGGGAYEHAAVLTPGYKCCNGRGCVVAFDPQSGEIVWKYDVGPEPETFDPPIKIRVSGVERTYHYGPSTSSVWSTPSYDETSHTIYFGTDVHNAPRRATDDDPRIYTPHSAAIIALDVRDGSEKWISQLSKGDVWNHTLPTYDRRTGEYKDQSIGDTPKIYSTKVEGELTQVVGVGSKNGGFYVLRADDGRIAFESTRYTGPPTGDPTVDPRTLALPSAIGGIQTGCATDGERVFVNGIDALLHFPSGGRVTAISLDTAQEFWRHDRSKLAEVPRRGGEPFRNVGDPVASGIAIANGVAYFTTLVSNQLVAIDTSTGELLVEIPMGPVFCGPSVSRGRVFVGSGNTLWSASPSEDFFPKRFTGTLYSFGLPGTDEIDRIGDKE
jgi:polyvinyl alcohol dehydrogenase (cytochrome)